LVWLPHIKTGPDYIRAGQGENEKAAILRSSPKLNRASNHRNQKHYGLRVIANLPIP
jgi:hypothetical protein